MGYQIRSLTKNGKRKKPYYASERLFRRIMRAKGIRLIPYPQRFYVFVCGRPTTYTPDFKERDKAVYYEVTNQSACYEQNKEKYKSFRELNPSLQLIHVKPNGEPYEHRERRRKTEKPYQETAYYSQERGVISLC